jgi:hypothetical protein
MMSLPARQQRMLDGIERVLQASEPKLASMFAIFARLTSDEGPAMTERLRPRRLDPRRLAHNRNLGAL